MIVFLNLPGLLTWFSVRFSSSRDYRVYSYCAIFFHWAIYNCSYSARKLALFTTLIASRSNLTIHVLLQDLYKEMVCTVFLWDNGFVLELHQVLKGLQEPNLIIPNVFTMLSSLQLCVYLVYTVYIQYFTGALVKPLPHPHPFSLLLLGETKKKHK